jgi:hypothetical protein
VRPDRHEVNTDVTMNDFWLMVSAFVAGYLAAFLRERIALRRERNAERMTLGSGAASSARGLGAGSRFNPSDGRQA